MHIYIAYKTNYKAFLGMYTVYSNLLFSEERTGFMKFLNESPVISSQLVNFDLQSVGFTPGYFE